MDHVVPLKSHSGAGGEKPPKTPRERFLAVAPQRTAQVLERLRLLSNCANKTGYQYDEDEVRQMMDAIQHEVDRVRALFEGKRKKEFAFRK